MGIKTVPHTLYSPDLSPCDFWLFPKLKEKLRGYRYETIVEMKEAVTKVIDTLTQEDLHGAFQKLLEQYNKCIAAGGDYFEGGLSFLCVLSIKVPIRKKTGNLFNDPRIMFTWNTDAIIAFHWGSIVCYHNLFASFLFCSSENLWDLIFSGNILRNTETGSVFPWAFVSIFRCVIYWPSTEPSIKRCTCVD